MSGHLQRRDNYHGRR